MDNMGHHNSHVGIPKTLLNSYSDSHPLYVGDLNRNKIYLSTPDKIGIIKDYYNDEVEQMLSNNLETGLGSLIKTIKGMKKYSDIAKYLNKNHTIIEEFVKIQLQRSKKSLDSFNENSLTSKVYGELSHSDYLEMVFKVDNINMLSMIGGNLFARVCVANEKHCFVTNSLGFYFIPNVETKSIISIVIPYESKKAIYIERFREDEKPASHYYVPDSHILYLNKLCYSFDKNVGNGLLVSTERSELEILMSNNKK